ncbi:MAG: hypothetical protein R3290_02745 [Acidimicrobiia bacterium]|nr:hypothetical protein [Acidimicrobiia bacterium]
MTDIDVRPAGGDTYEVTITDDGSTSTHTVAVGPDEVRALGAPDAEAAIVASFRFLLDREPKESILGRFDLLSIGRYFPEYRSRLGDYL